MQEAESVWFHRPQICYCYPATSFGGGVCSLLLLCEELLSCPTEEDCSSKVTDELPPPDELLLPPVQAPKATQPTVNIILMSKITSFFIEFLQGYPLQDTHFRHYYSTIVCVFLSIPCIYQKPCNLAVFFLKILINLTDL